MYIKDTKDTNFNTDILDHNITESEVRDAIRALKCKESTDSAGLCGEFYKCANTQLDNILK